MLNRTLSIAVALLTALSFNASAQQRETFKKEPVVTAETKDEDALCPRAYMGLSTGINNNSGLIGFNVDVPVAPQFSVGAGFGYSTWGTKVYGEGRFYFTPGCHQGWAIGTGITHSTGFNKIELEVKDQYGYQHNAVLDMKAKTNIMVSAYRFWGLGRQKVNRFHLQLGYSVPLTATEYTISNNMILSDESDLAVRAISPGGLILGVGFTFRVF